MGTRALFGLRKDGIDKVVYRQMDGYPEGLGYEFVSMLKHVGINRLNEYFDKIECITADVPPTKEQIEYCGSMGWIDLSEWSSDTNNWFCLLHKAPNMQYIGAWQDAIMSDKPVFIENGINYIKDSRFCEYAYIYDFNSNQLEFYRGFQREPQEGNHYGTKPTVVFERKKYYPCALKALFSKNVIENETVEQITKKMLESK